MSAEQLLSSEQDKPKELPTEDQQIDRTLDDMEASSLGIMDSPLLKKIGDTIKDYIKEKLGDDPETEEQMKKIAVELREITNIDQQNKTDIEKGLSQFPAEAIRGRITECVQKLEYINSLFTHPNVKIRTWAGKNNEELSKLRTQVEGRRSTMENYLASLQQASKTPPTPPQAPDNTPKTPEKKEQDPEILLAEGLLTLCQNLIKTDRAGNTAWSRYTTAQKNDIGKRLVATSARMKMLHEDAVYNQADAVRIDKTSKIPAELARYYAILFNGLKMPN